MTAKRNLIGQHFGRWTVIDEAPRSSYGGTMWLCQCECGTIKEVAACNLSTGASQSCGCLQKELASERYSDQLAGKRFGNAVVIKRETAVTKQGDTLNKWLCQCDCGNTFLAIGRDLKSGIRTHCRECGLKNMRESAEKRQLDLAGQRFGKLVAIRKTNQRKYRSVVWECQCDCGNITYQPAGLLIRNEVASCGCTMFSAREKEIAELLSEYEIPYRHEMKFETCRFPNSGRLAHFDFYVNEEYIIEADGEQHFHAAGGYSTEETYQGIVYRDNYKNQWCAEHDIPIIRIPYTLKTVTINDLILETTKYRIA